MPTKLGKMVLTRVRDRRSGRDRRRKRQLDVLPTFEVFTRSERKVLQEVDRRRQLRRRADVLARLKAE